MLASLRFMAGTVAAMEAWPARCAYSCTAYRDVTP
eukprot:COSAG01_NODE_735_length_13969_cov_357.018241_15_plen_35_part_00